MPEYQIDFHRNERGFVTIEADDEDQAREKFWNGDYSQEVIQRSDLDIGDIEVY